MDGPYGPIRCLIKEGEHLELCDSESYQKLLRWLEEANLVLKSFPLEYDRFRLYCLESFAFPRQKLAFGLSFLQAALRKTGN